MTYLDQHDLPGSTSSSDLFGPTGTPNYRSDDALSRALRLVGEDVPAFVGIRQKIAR